MIQRLLANDLQANHNSIFFYCAENATNINCIRLYNITPASKNQIRTKGKRETILYSFVQQSHIIFATGALHGTGTSIIRATSGSGSSASCAAHLGSAQRGGDRYSPSLFVSSGSGNDGHSSRKPQAPRIRQVISTHGSLCSPGCRASGHELSRVETLWFTAALPASSPYHDDEDITTSHNHACG